MIDACLHRKWPDLAKGETFGPRPIYRSPLRKALEEDPDFKWLLEIADQAAPLVRDAFLKAVNAIRGTPKVAEVKAALEAGDTNAVLEALGIGTVDETIKAEILPPLEDAFIAAGRATPAKSGIVSMRFDLMNPEVKRFLSGYQMDLITEISDETRQAIRQVVTAAMTEGGRGSPRVYAREIRDMIGLTQRQVTAVQNYRAGLVAEDRDPEQVDRMVAQYQAGALRQRAENIARTETLRASNAGQNAAWEQAADQGLLSRATVRRKWLVTPDDRLCSFCSEIPILNPNGVRLGEAFTTMFGPVQYAPLHPQCRCITILSAF